MCDIFLNLNFAFLFFFHLLGCFEGGALDSRFTFLCSLSIYGRDARFSCSSSVFVDARKRLENYRTVMESRAAESPGWVHACI